MNAVISIYQILNKINGKFYIGSTCSTKQRWEEHINSLNRGKHHSIHLQRAWDKYGKENFEFRILFQCSKKNRKLWEQYLLDTLKPCDINVGYNMNSKVNGIDGRLISKETREKRRQLLLGKPSLRKGMKATKETIQKLSLSHIGQKSWNKGKKGVYSKETRYKMGVFKRGCSAWGNGIKGKSVAWNKGLTKETDIRIAKTANSDEIRLKRSIAVKKWWEQRKLKKEEYAA